MCSSHKHIALLLLTLFWQLPGSSQSTLQKPIPFFPYLADTSISYQDCRDLIVEGILVQEISREDFFKTPMYFFHNQDLYKSYISFNRLLAVYPDALEETEYQLPIVHSYDFAHDIESIAPLVWPVIAQRYDEQSFIQFPNVFYNALQKQETYLQNEDKRKTNEKIVSANTEIDETKFSMDYRQEKMLVSKHDRLGGESFYIAQKVEGEWSPYTKEPFVTVVKNTETAASIDASGRFVLYTQCMAKAWEPYGGGGCDLWFTSAVNDSIWSPAQKYKAGINTPSFEGLGTFSTDGRVLYFTSDREGGYGGRDIWFSEWDGTQWKIAQNAGEKINSTADEFSPYISEDGTALFFASNRERQSDIYYYSYKSDTVKKLPAPINTKYDEISCHVNSQEGHIIVASNAHSKKQDFDLEIYSLPEEFYSDSTKTISGQMLYLHSLQPYYAEYARDLGFDTQEDVFKITNRGNGWYFWDIVTGIPVEKMNVRNLLTFDDKTLQIPIPDDYLSKRLIWNQLFH